MEGKLMIKTDKTIDGKVLGYEIKENGYLIYLDEILWISQLEPYGKPKDKEKSYEENCLMQIDEITKPVSEPNKYNIPDETLNEILDDHNAMLIEGGIL